MKKNILKLGCYKNMKLKKIKKKKKLKNNYDVMDEWNIGFRKKNNKKYDK